MRAEQTYNNADPDSVATWSATATYNFGDEALKNGVVYYSLEKDNTGNDPETEHLKWIAERNENKECVYDVYPDTFTTKSNGTLKLKWSVTDVDTFYVGNAHGTKITLKVGGTTYTKNIDTTSVSPLTVWGVNALKEVDSFYVEFPKFTGTIELQITKAPSDNKASLGFVNYGRRKSVGCTLLNTIKYNVRTGVNPSSKGVSRRRVRTQSYEEITLPIKIFDVTKVNSVIRTLAKYRGVPVLIIGDDLGVREETIFHGIYTDIEASIADQNTYNITLRSLKYEAFVPPDNIEQLRARSEDEQAQQGQKNELELKLEYPVNISAGAGVPDPSEFEGDTKLIFDKSKPCDIYYKDGAGNVKLCKTPAKVTSKNGVPTHSDFASTGAKFIFNENSPCDVYYDNGGTVSKCDPVINGKNGKPTSSDFNNGSAIIFDTSKPCDIYYKKGGTVKVCKQGMKGYTGTPPASAFYNAELIYDRTNPCDIYYLDGSTVKKCESGSSGVWIGRFKAKNKTGGTLKSKDATGVFSIEKSTNVEAGGFGSKAYWGLQIFGCEYDYKIYAINGSNGNETLVANGSGSSGAKVEGEASVAGTIHDEIKFSIRAKPFVTFTI